MKNKKKFLKVASRFFFFVLAFVLIFTIPKISVGYGDNFELIYKSFVGEKCEYQGFIEVWNIDTFEAGKKSKTDILKDAAIRFQKQNRGLFVMVRNLLPNECINLLANGQRPDLFSCGIGFSNVIKDYVCEFENFDGSELYSNYLISGKDGEKQIAIPWCSGAYFLFSTTDKLRDAKIEIENKNLSDIIFNAGYVKKVGKKSKTIYSLAFGSGDYIFPKNCLNAYNKEASLPEFAFDETKNISTYSAYAEFLSGGSTILLGTQRDAVRLDGRIKNEKISNVICEPVKYYNDLVQVFFKTQNNENDMRSKYAQKFAEFMLKSEVQESVVLSGLLPVTKAVNLKYEDSVMSNITPDIIGSYEVKRVFS